MTKGWIKDDKEGKSDLRATRCHSELVEESRAFSRGQRGATRRKIKAFAVLTVKI